MEREGRVYSVRCVDCGPKGTAVITGPKEMLPDCFHQVVLGCFCELTAVDSLPEPPKKKSKSMQRNIDMLERCLAIMPPQNFMFGEPYGDE